MVLGDRENVRSIEESVCDMIVEGAQRFIHMRASLLARKSNQIYKMSKKWPFFDFFSKKIGKRIFYATNLAVLRDFI